MIDDNTLEFSLRPSFFNTGTFNANHERQIGSYDLKVSWTEPNNSKELPGRFANALLLDAYRLTKPLADETIAWEKLVVEVNTGREGERVNTFAPGGLNQVEGLTQGLDKFIFSAGFHFRLTQQQYCWVWVVEKRTEKGKETFRDLPFVNAVWNTYGSTVSAPARQFNSFFSNTQSLGLTEMELTLVLTKEGASNASQDVLAVSAPMVIRLAENKVEVQLWQKLEIRAPTGNDGPASFKVEFIRMIGGAETRVESEILAVRPGFVTVRVPPGLLGPADVSVPPTGVDDNVRMVVLRASDRREIALQPLILRLPQPIIVDELDVRVDSPGLRTLSQFVFNTGSPNIQTFSFLGKSSDGLMGLRVLNSELGFPGPLLFDAEDVVVFEPGGGSAPLQRTGAPFHIPNLGSGNQGVQFTVSKNGLYVFAIGPNASSPGPFPARYQFHLAGNVGLPRKLIKGIAEAPRGTRLDTLFNHPAPRPQSLLTVTAAEARTALFKFANVASISQFARAVLLPPAGGFTSGMRIARAADPTAPLELTTPTARTPDCAAPVIGTVIDFTQIPDPASVTEPAAPPLSESVCAVIGENDGHAVTLPKVLPGGAGTISSLILDMGSGHEIVDGTGADFEVLAASGSYTVQVGNTPYAGSFSAALGPFTGVRQIDLATAGLTTARYVWITSSPGVVLDAVRALNHFADEVSPTIGPVTHVTSATITARRAKTASNNLDPFLQLIAPNGDLFGENEAGFGDDLTQDKSAAALVNRILPQDGFYRYLVKGFDKQPDEQSMGAFFTRLETAGAYDQVELAVSNLGEAQTPAQRTGTFSSTRQRDSYLFQAAPGQTVNIVVNATGNGPKVNPVVELFDPEYLLIAANDDFPRRERNAALSATLPVQALALGTYRVVVSAVDGFGTGSGFNGGTAHIRQAAAGGYELKVFTGPMIVVPAGGVEAWRTASFSANVLADPGKEATVWGDHANPDGDPLPNLLEYFTGSNPLMADPDAMRLERTPGGLPALVYRQAKNAPGVESFPEWTPSLGNWRRDQVILEVVSETAEARIVRASFPALGGDRSGYARLAAEKR
ncbi:MAG: hypothetical protein O3C21_05465 [Verrucomicrobia bacterium]|nr:hypothetical protein [Verrucomicrobiota bacterium]